jgi:hypothetical protein
MARETLIRVVSRAQAVGIRVKLRKHRVEFPHPDHRRAIGNIGTIVAGGLKLARAQDPLDERFQLVLVNCFACRRISADHRWMWNWNSLLLQSATRVLNAATHSGIFLSEEPVGAGKQSTRNCKVLNKLSAHSHTLSMFSRLDVKKGEAGQPLTHKLRKRTGKSVQEFFVIGKKTASRLRGRSFALT